MGKTSIEWVKGPDGSDGMSWNALRAVRKNGGQSAHHCEHVNEACRFCYAERLNARLGGLPFKPGHRADYNFVINERTLREPLKRRKPTRYFVESMSDAFGDWWTDEQIDQLYAVMAICQRHTFINLSKRPERRRRYLDDASLEDRLDNICHTLNPDVDETWHYPAKWPLPNVIEGTSVSCQAEADKFLPILLATRAAVLAVSAEPLLGPIDFRHIADDGITEHNALSGEHLFSDVPQGRRLSWVIVGGESGPHARPMHPDWARSIRDQCAAAGVPFHFKQWGEWAPHGGSAEQWPPRGPEKVTYHNFGDRNLIAAQVFRIGKKAARPPAGRRRAQRLPSMSALTRLTMIDTEKPLQNLPATGMMISGDSGGDQGKHGGPAGDRYSRGRQGPHLPPSVKAAAACWTASSTTDFLNAARSAPAPCGDGGAAPSGGAAGLVSARRIATARCRAR